MLSKHLSDLDLSLFLLRVYVLYSVLSPFILEYLPSTHNPQRYFLPIMLQEVLIKVVIEALTEADGEMKASILVATMAIGVEKVDLTIILKEINEILLQLHQTCITHPIMPLSFLARSVV